MTPPIHFEVELLYDTTFTTACGVTPTIKNATTDDAQVTCRKCLAEMGYDVAALVEVERLEPRDGYDERIAA